MKFLILNTDYPEYLAWLYARYPGLEDSSYDEQMRARMDHCCGIADFYSANLRLLGHEAYDVHFNNEHLQSQWARENWAEGKTGLRRSWGLGRALRTLMTAARKTPLRRLGPLMPPSVRSLGRHEAWLYEILGAQIRKMKPDVLLNQAMDGISSSFLREMKPYVWLLVGQIASPLPPDPDFRGYDLVISSLPNFVEYFRSLGLASEYHRLGFEPRVLEHLRPGERTTPVTFVGSVSPWHKSRLALLEHLCSRFDIQIWGTGAEVLAPGSPIRRRYMGHAWGIEMYEVLRDSKITINQHIDVSGPYANNMRLYEATGVGTLLVTDHKQNLADLFAPGEEVAAYRTPEECAELVSYYLEHDEERERIARAGQERTLRDHTYQRRMQELVEIVGKYLR
jgi:hypothetical protein